MEFFTISKLLSAATQPMTWVVAVIAIATLISKKRPKLSKALLVLSLLSIGLLGFERLPNALLAPLESQYPVPSASSLRNIQGVIVLGGATEHPAIFAQHQEVTTGEAGERMAVAAALLVTNPNWKLLFSGGEGRLNRTGVPEGVLAKRYFDAFGITSDRLILETNSRNTRENAIEVAKLLGADCGPGWLLITSAWHMPRAYTQFRNIGCLATPYPVDFRSADGLGWVEYSLANSLKLWQTALHEWLGLLMYRLVY